MASEKESSFWNEKLKYNAFPNGQWQMAAVSITEACFIFEEA